MRKKAKSAESIIERDDDGALFRERRSIVSLLAAEPGEETAAVNPNQYGARGAGSGTRE